MSWEVSVMEFVLSGLLASRNSNGGYNSGSSNSIAVSGIAAGRHLPFEFCSVKKIVRKSCACQKLFIQKNANFGLKHPHFGEI